MPNYVPITENLVLVEQEIKTKKTVKKRDPLNHIWIFDRSYSMCYDLPKLTDQLVHLSREIPRSDLLSLGWFSGEGDFNWIVKGFKVTDASDYKALEKSIKANASPRNTTCFSEILLDSRKVIEDLSVFSDVFSLHFFTDGYPVVSSYKKELDGIFGAIKAIKGKVHTSMFLAYGHHYNKQLLSDMAENLGSMLIHSSEIPEYTKSITKLVKLSGSLEPKEEVAPVVDNPLAVYTVTGEGVVVNSIDEGKLYVAPQKGKSTFIYYLYTGQPNKKSWHKVETGDIHFAEEEDRLSKALYGGALVLSQQTKTDQALEILGKIGDKKLIDDLYNAFQVEEFGAAEKSIEAAVQDIEERFSSGRDSNYLPKADAFCTYDVLTLLTEDEKAAFFPYHERFKYERIGVASQSKLGYPKFIPDKSSKCPFTDLTWHESRLNLSVRTKVQGTIELHDVDGKTPQQMGFSSPYPVHVFRNFSMIKDGHINSPKFYVTSSEKAYKKFKNEGIVFEDTFKKDGIYGLDISSLPVINRAIAEGKTSGSALCEMVLKEHRLKAQIKALKWLQKDVFGEEEKGVPASFSEEQSSFLASHGVSLSQGGLFNPPTERMDPVDFYMANRFQVKLKKISTLPGVKKVRDKISADKSRTPAEALIEAGIDLWNKAEPTLKGDLGKKMWFEDAIKSRQEQMRGIRKNLQKIKFAVLLGRKWFEEFDSRENCELTVDGVTCSFCMDEEKVPV